MLPCLAGGLHADLGPVGDEDAREGSGLPCVIIDVSRPRADQGAVRANGERRLTVVLDKVPDRDVTRP